MTIPLELSVTRPVPQSPVASRPVSRSRRALRLLLIFLVLFILSVLLPVTFRLEVKGLLALEAWQRGASVETGVVGGSLFSPVTVKDFHWRYLGRQGSSTDVAVSHAEAEFAWREALPGRHGHFFRRLTLDGVNARVEVPDPAATQAAPTPVPAHEPQPAWYPSPSQVEATNVDVLFRTKDRWVRVGHCRFLLSEVERGVIEAGQLEVHQPWLKHTFRNLHGTTTLQDGRFTVTELPLEQGMTVQQLTADLRRLVGGGLNLSVQVTAFGGQIDAQARSIMPDKGGGLQATLDFSQIGIAPLATFLGISDAAGGTIRVGNITFRGSPRDPSHAAVTARVEATNFQWESRQWDSLVLGARLLDRRLQVPELQLRQGHNQLSLNGEMTFPENDRPWWQSDFNFNVNGRVENLTELSALVLPDFRYAAGKVRIDGAVRARDQQYYGTLIVSGSDLTWRSAPIQDLRAGLRLEGKELQIASFDLYNKGENKDDYVRGQGSISLDGTGAWKGEVRASVEDLRTYSTILGNPLLPEPLAGGAVIRWSGESSGKGQSGQFAGRFRKVRPIEASLPAACPLDLEMEGSYTPDGVRFSRLQIAEGACTLTTEAEVAAKSLTLRGVRLTRGADTWLQGDAMLPLTLPAAWPESGGVPLIMPDAPGRLDLKLSGLSLTEAVRLTGRAWPVAGKVTGSLAAAGSLSRLEGSSHLEVAAGSMPWTAGEAKEIAGTLDQAGQLITSNQLTARLPSGVWNGAGTLNLENWRDPVLQAQFEAPQAAVTLLRGLQWQAITAAGVEVPGSATLQADIRLKAAGPLSSATLSGEIWPAALQSSGQPEISDWWRSPSFPVLGPVVEWPPALAGWQLDLRCAPPTTIPVEPALGSLQPDLRVTGRASAPVLNGTVHFTRVPAIAGPLPLMVDEATVTFRSPGANDPAVDLHATGLMEHFPFSAWVVGPVSRHIAFVDSETARAAILARRPARAQESPGASALPVPLPAPGTAGTPPPVEAPVAIRP